ncbi:PHB depolymerase family esterase [Limibacter armeniacum]|uniref:alpha/beta hydrolase-fold protein n=1 Tax=Limibacter armeniacum TaxID=466084 RepID=UPI002FE51F3F
MNFSSLYLTVLILFIGISTKVYSQSNSVDVYYGTKSVRVKSTDGSVVSWKVILHSSDLNISSVSSFNTAFEGSSQYLSKQSYNDGSFTIEGLEPKSQYYIYVLVRQNGEDKLVFQQFQTHTRQSQLYYNSDPSKGDGHIHAYTVYFPEKYYLYPEQDYPVLLCLHGQGEKGELDYGSLMRHGPPKLVNQGRDFPMIIAAVQSYKWAGGWEPNVVNEFTDLLMAQYRVDKTRLYVTGFSMGGGGTFNFAAAYPEKVAAIVPISGWLTGEACNVKMPTWAFHNENDGTVNSNGTKSAVSRINSCLDPDPAKATIYNSSGHDAWSKTYSGSAGYDIYSWLLQYSNSSAGNKVQLPDISLTVDNTSFNSIAVSWTHDASELALQYTITLKDIEQNTVVKTVDITDNTSSYQFEGLACITTYEVSICGSVDAAETCDNVEVTTKAMDTPVITASHTSLNNGPVTLSLAEAYDSYEWSNGATGASIVVDKAGEYFVKVGLGECSANSNTVSVTETTSIEKGELLPVEFSASSGARYATFVYTPKDYASSSEKYPILFVFHSDEQRGSLEYDKLLTAGPIKEVNEGRDFPFIIVSIQNGKWAGSWDIDLMNELVESMKSQYRIDDNKLYFTGWQKGALACYNYATAYPGKVNAMVTFSSWGSGEVCSIAQSRVWYIQNENDPVVSLSSAEGFVNRLQACGSGEVKMNYYPDATENDSWDKTYEADAPWDIYSWLYDTSETGTGAVEQQQASHLQQSFTSSQTGKQHGYYLYLPDEYGDGQRNLPLMVVLHGQDERGELEYDKLLLNGPAKLIEEGKNFPFVVLTPQNSKWAGSWNVEMVKELIAHVKSEYGLTDIKLWMTGWETGAIAAYAFTEKYSDEVDAVVGFGSWGIGEVCNMATVRTWIFHNAADENVSVGSVKSFVNSLTSCSAAIDDINLTVYEDLTGDDCWNPTFEETTSANLYEWLLGASEANSRMAFGTLGEISEEKLLFSNPMTNSVFIKKDLVTPSSSKLELYSVNGERYSIDLSENGNGYYRGAIGGLPTGLYLIKIVFEEKVITHKLLKLK